MKTWVEEKEWAKRESKKGRAMGRMIMGVKKGLEVEEGGGGREKEELVRKVKVGGIGGG